MADTNAAFGQYFLKDAVRHCVTEVEEHRMKDY
mgnify:CR=1 FL=1